MGKIKNSWQWCISNRLLHMLIQLVCANVIALTCTNLENIQIFKYSNILNFVVQHNMLLML